MTGLRIWHAFAACMMLFALASSGICGGAIADGAARGPAREIAVRAGDHDDFGRLVIDTTGGTTYSLDRDGDHVVARFNGDVTLANPPAAPRNVMAIATNGSTIELILKRDAKLRATRLDGRVVFDILDPPNAAAASVNPHRETRREPRLRPPLSMASSAELGGRSMLASGTPAPAPATALLADPSTRPNAVPPEAAARAPVTAQPLPPALPDSGPSATAQTDGHDVIEITQPTPPGRDALPKNDTISGLLAHRVAPPKDVDGSAFLVPFDSGTGAAAFRSGDNVYAIFDQRRPVDMSALRADPTFGSVTVQLLASGTLLRIPLPPARSLALTETPRGWRITAMTAAPKQLPIGVSYADGSMQLAADQPGEVVTLADPDTGATLLVGTQHHPGQGMASGRRSAEFTLRPTLQGVVVEPLADAIALKKVPSGFTLAGGPGGLALSEPSGSMDGQVDSALLTKRFAFSTAPDEALLRRTIKEVGDAAAAPPLGRGHKNHIAAESFIALGLGAEAESLLQLAAEQDPKEAASPDNAALAAIAALLAGRPEDSDALTDPRLDGTDEIALWRAIRQATLEDGSPAAASVFAADAPLALQYPPPIRDHILPIIVETMIRNGELAPAARMLDQRKNDPALAYARALMQQASGDPDEALSLLDALANGRDQFNRARAAIRAVELRLETQKLDKVQAADALDKLLYAWRGDAREIALRERIGELRGQTGSWRVALATLRQAETDFPEQAKPIHERLKDLFSAMIHDQGVQQIPPIDFVSMIDDNVDVVVSGDDGTVQQSLADRLLALDLPARAKTVLEKLIRSAKQDVTKARFGATLAAIEAREGDDSDARAVLDGSEGKDLPADLTEKRTILRAGSVARMGDPTAAVALLVPLHTVAGAEARAQILENASDWAGAEQAWLECVTQMLPESGALDEPQTRTLLRLATATARASDDAGLAGLRGKYGERIGSSPLADMFRLLTAEPVRTTADITRSQREVNLAASLPAGLKALQAGPNPR